MSNIIVGCFGPPECQVLSPADKAFLPDTAGVRLEEVDGMKNVSSATSGIIHHVKEMKRAFNMCIVTVYFFFFSKQIEVLAVPIKLTCTQYCFSKSTSGQNENERRFEV